MRQALNRIQNDAADVVTLAMLKTYPCPEDHELQWRYPRRWGCPTLHELGARLVLQIHDELLFLVPERSIEHAAEVTQSVMQDAVRLHCPLETSAGWAQDWSGAHGG
ncbi:MAG: hypothetical protein D6746_03385 [Bacteroidetes bacterium]|nr:MAG: hypothetical protein D6746_03385 [Bacteroidota bacterium]